MKYVKDVVVVLAVILVSVFYIILVAGLFYLVSKFNSNHFFLLYPLVVFSFFTITSIALEEHTRRKL